MYKKLFVGNLAFLTTESELRDAFGQFGEVQSVNLISDRTTGRSKGFAFVEMDTEDADKAMEGLSGIQLHGRNLTVNEAKPLVRRNNSEDGGRMEQAVNRNRF